MVKALLDCREARFDHRLKFEVGEDIWPVPFDAFADEFTMVDRGDQGIRSASRNPVVPATSTSAFLHSLDPNETFGRLALLANANTLYLRVSNGKAIKQRDLIVLIGAQL